MDKRTEQLAKNIVNYSCRLQKGENALISCTGEEATPLERAAIKEIYKVGAKPYVEFKNSSVERDFLMGVTQEQLELMAGIECERMSKMQAYIGIKADNNISELSDVPEEKIKMYSQKLQSL